MWSSLFYTFFFPLGEENENENEMIKVEFDVQVDLGCIVVALNDVKSTHSIMVSTADFDSVNLSSILSGCISYFLFMFLLCLNSGFQLKQLVWDIIWHN